MKIKLKTQGHFDASHHLLNYKGVCANNHGHRWNVTVLVEGDSNDLDKSNILIDFKHIKSCWDCYDHKDLNEYFGSTEKDGDSPSAEFIAMKILESLKMIKNLKYKVQVYESPESCAEVGDDI